MTRTLYYGIGGKLKKLSNKLFKITELWTREKAIFNGKSTPVDVSEPDLNLNQCTNNIWLNEDECLASSSDWREIRVK